MENVIDTTEQKKNVIDCTPTWRGILPMLLDAYATVHKPELVKDILAELQRMADAADEYNKLVQQFKNHSMPIVISLTDQQHEDLIVTAIEGGSNYWYYLPTSSVNLIKKATPDEKDEPLSTRMWKAIKAGAIIPIHDVEDPKEKIGEISLVSIEKGEQLLADKHSNHLADILNENEDANTADVWFQLCSLGEIVYG
jgi:hypothetical protein